MMKEGVSINQLMLDIELQKQIAKTEFNILVIRYFIILSVTTCISLVIERYTLKNGAQPYNDEIDDAIYPVWIIGVLLMLGAFAKYVINIRSSKIVELYK